LTLTVAGDRVDAVTELLEAAGARAVRFEEASGPAFYDEGIAEEPRYWPLTRICAFFEGEAACRFGALVVACETQTSTYEHVTDEGWEARTQASWQPFPIMDALWIYPNAQQAPPEHLAIHLDPGLAFGTGTHPTTRLCLQWLYGALKDPSFTDCDVLDFGCGSGILAIAALRLGARHAWAFDIDPLALDATKANALRNEVADRLTISSCASAHNIGYGLVVANILAGPLITHAQTLSQAVATGGRLALSGILEDQIERVARAFPDFTLTPVKEDGWCLLEGGRA